MQKIFSLFAFLFLTACSPTFEKRGHELSEIDTRRIQIKKDTAETLEQKLGSPTYVSSFSNNAQESVWYYIFQKTEKTSFFDASLIEHNVLIVHFSPAGIVQKFNVSDQLPKNIGKPSREKTEFKEKSDGLLKDIFGNIGKVSMPTNGPGPM